MNEYLDDMGELKTEWAATMARTITTDILQHNQAYHVIEFLIVSLLVSKLKDEPWIKV